MLRRLIIDAIRNDPDWKEGHHPAARAPHAGIGAAEPVGSMP
jgi:homoserine acetyltransferase